MQNPLITKMIIRTFLSAYFLCVGSLFAFAETTKTKPNSRQFDASNKLDLKAVSPYPLRTLPHVGFI